MRKIVLWLLLTGMLIVSTGSANALIQVSFDPADKYAGVGSVFNVNILADIPQADATVGWGFNLLYDPLKMTLQNATGGSGWDVLQLAQNNLTGFLNPIPTSPPYGMSGDDILLATLTFECLGQGTSGLDISVNPDDLTQGFVRGLAVGTAGPTFADWQSTPGTVTQGTTPEPSTFLLFGGGLATMVWLRRRKS